MIRSKDGHTASIQARCQPEKYKQAQTHFKVRFEFEPFNARRTSMLLLLSGASDGLFELRRVKEQITWIFKSYSLLW